MPSARTMALLINPTNPALMSATTKQAEAAALSLGVDLHVLQARTDREFDAVFVRLAELRSADS